MRMADRIECDLQKLLVWEHGKVQCCVLKQPGSNLSEYSTNIACELKTVWNEIIMIHESCWESIWIDR